MSREVTLTLVVSTLCSSLAFAANFNITGIQQCETSFYNCATNLSSQNYSVCTNSFEQCMNTSAYLVPKKSLDCFLAESGWVNFRVSLAFSLTVFFFSTLLFPAILKVVSKGATYAANIDKEAYPVIWSIGQVAAFFFAESGKKEITPSSLISPQLLFTFASVGLPIVQWVAANDQQQKCDYSKTLLQ